MSERKTIKLTEEEFEDVEYNSDKWKEISSKITGQSRWSTFYRCVVQNLETGEFYSYRMEHGSTEYQDYNHWDDNDTIELTQVFPVEKTIIVYE